MGGSAHKDISLEDLFFGEESGRESQSKDSYDAIPAPRWKSVGFASPVTHVSFANFIGSNTGAPHVYMP